MIMMVAQTRQDPVLTHESRMLSRTSCHCSSRLHRLIDAAHQSPLCPTCVGEVR
jgi:hypothetical protein